MRCNIFIIKYYFDGEGYWCPLGHEAKVFSSFKEFCSE